MEIIKGQMCVVGSIRKDLRGRKNAARAVGRLLLTGEKDARSELRSAKIMIDSKSKGSDTLTVNLADRVMFKYRDLSHMEHAIKIMLYFDIGFGPQIVECSFASSVRVSEDCTLTLSPNDEVIRALAKR